MLDVTRLRVLAAVARHGSVTAAAQALHYAQPSVSHHLARLEAETGSTLVQRIGRGVRLTEAGQLLAERAEEIIGRLDAAEQELAAHTGLRAGRVRLAAFPSALGTIVPAAAAVFAAEHPGVRLQLIEAEPPDALRLLRSGAADVALVFTYPEDDFAAHDLRRIHLLREPTYLVTRPGTVPDPTAEDPTAEDPTPGDPMADPMAAPGLADERWIAGCERCRDHLLRTCAAAGFVPDVRYTTDDYVAVQALVAAGLGVTVLPALALAAHRHLGVRVARLPGGREVAVALPGRPPDPPASAALVRHLQDAAAVALCAAAAL